MTLTATADIADIRKRGRETQTLVLIAFFLAASSVLGNVVVDPLAHQIKGAGLSALVPDILDNLVSAASMIILVWGLWSAQKVFGRVAAGEVFTRANARGVADIGAAMGWCGVTEVFLTPSLRALIARSGPFDFHWTGWAVVLAALGGAVVLIGRIWALAADIKADSDQIV